MNADNRFEFQILTHRDERLRRFALVSVAVHVAVVAIVLLVNGIGSKPVTKVNPYIFEMVSSVSPKVRTAKNRAVPQKVQEKNIVKEKPAEKPADKSWQSKKSEEKVAEKVVEQKEVQQESTSWDEVAEPEKNTTQDVGAVETATNEMTIQQSNFPYSYYGAQIRNAVEVNWRQTPQELLGSENQLVVTVKFTILKNGTIT
ncbi:MAG: hypothetical protein JNL74_11370, partial [Fibrobacteres bacterium]|nr:hypothetical protein [Fibrobacterota bacterium]